MTQQPMEQPEQQAEQPTVGKQLQMARMAKKQDLASVAAQLRLDIKMVQALEEDDHQQLPEPIFVRGYIQAYARLMGLDASPLLARYNELAPSEPTLAGAKPNAAFSGTQMPQRHSDSKLSALLMPLLAVVVVLAIALAAWQFWPSPSAEGEAEQSFTLDGELPLPAATTEPLPVAPVELEMDTAIEEIAIESAPSATLPVVEVAVEPRPEPPVVILDSLRLEAESDSWVTIHDSRGERVMYDLLKAESSRQVEGVAPFRVLLGYAAGVSVSINGESFDVTPHIKENSARFIVEAP